MHSRLGRGARAGATCAAAVPRAIGHHRDFLKQPGTGFTLTALALLAAAVVVHPAGAVSGTHREDGLYIAAAAVGSVYIWWSAMQGIRARDFTADIPVSIATAAAIAVGYYSAAAIVAVLLLLGGLLEEFVAARAGHALDALDALEQMLPNEVTVRRGGRDELVALDAVAVGDVVLVRPGERIAVDGEVGGGQATVDQAAITGESMPAEKTVGDSVFAGTLPALGALEVRARDVGAQTTLGQIRQVVADADQQAAPIERILDRYAKLYPGRDPSGGDPVGGDRHPDPRRTRDHRRPPTWRIRHPRPAGPSRQRRAVL